MVYYVNMKLNEVVFITSSESPHLSASDSLLITPLRKKEIIVRALPWDDLEIDWTRFTSIILRSCWNYHYNYPLFLKWLWKLKEKHVQLWNPIDVVIWNSNKKYLRDLENKGIPTIPTVWVSQKEKIELEIISKDKGWKDMVIKPCVGASAHEIIKASFGAYISAQIKIDELVQKTDVMIQPLMHEVITEGEYSLIFIDGEFSHAILKRPKKGDFRSNYHYGATKKKVTLDKRFISQALNILKTIESPLLYARVDGIRRKDTFILMELELIEPHLFFDHDSQSPIRFAEALAGKI